MRNAISLLCYQLSGHYNNGPKVSIFKFPEQPELRKLNSSQERILSQVIHQGFVNDTLLQQIFNELKKYLMRLQEKKLMQLWDILVLFLVPFRKFSRLSFLLS